MKTGWRGLRERDREADSEKGETETEGQEETAGRENISVVVKALKNNGVLHEAKIYSGHPAVLSLSQIPRVGQGFTWSHTERQGST